MSPKDTLLFRSCLASCLWVACKDLMPAQTLEIGNRSIKALSVGNLLLAAYQMAETPETLVIWDCSADRFQQCKNPEGSPSAKGNEGRVSS